MGKRSTRSDELLRLLRSEGEMSISDLAQTLGTSPSTIRRDLGELARSKRVLRTYGGAAIADPARVRAAPPFELQTKGLIGAAAAARVHDGDTIVVTGGTTTLELARRLIDHRDLTVITNSLDVALTLVDRPGVTVIVLGGVARPGIHSLLGHITESAAKDLRADRLFMGIPAIDPTRGLMSDHMPEVLTDRAIMRIVREVVVLADSSKLKRVEPAVVCGLGDISTLVTDGGISSQDRAVLESHGIDVVVAERPAGVGNTSGSASRSRVDRTVEVRY
jgi:DeoR family transcriptional regulator of aga operon